jgi:hypothetical protein
VVVAVVVAALAAGVAVAGSTSDSHALLASGAVGGTSNLLQVLHPAPMALAQQVCGNACIELLIKFS